MREALDLLVKADSTLSWMRHRSQVHWDNNKIDNLIGQIRRFYGPHLTDPDAQPTPEEPVGARITVTVVEEDEKAKPWRIRLTVGDHEEWWGFRSVSPASHWTKKEDAEEQAERLRAALQREPVASDLAYRLSVQNGSGGTDEEHREAMQGWEKITGEGPGDFGSPVEIRFRWEDGEEVVEWSEHGYLTTLPGHTDPDTDGIIHLPETHGAKGKGDPVWLTQLDAALLPDVVEVVIGRRTLAPVAGEEDGERE